MKKYLAVALLLCAWIGATYAQPPNPTRTWNTTPLFDEGTYENTNSRDVPNEVRLNRGTSLTFENAWIANSGDALLYKVNLTTGKVVAAYLTAPPRTPGRLYDSDGCCGFCGNQSPSRTAVDRNGNVWVANRHFGGQASVTQILAEGGEPTSHIPDGPAPVADPRRPGDVLPWGQDARVVRYYLVGGGSGLARALAIGPDGHIYVGMYNERRIYRLRPDEVAPPPAGARPTPVRVYDMPFSPYGFAFGPNGRLYATGLGGPLYELNVDTGVGRTLTGMGGYGIAVDSNGVVWQGGGGYRTDPRTYPAAGSVRYIGNANAGLTVDRDGNIWGSAGTQVTKSRPDGTRIGNYTHGGQYAYGMGIAPNGDVVISNYYGAAVTQVKTDGSRVRTIPTAPSGFGTPCLYTYSDFTGSGRGQTTERLGRWTVRFNSQVDFANWGTVDWTSLEPSGTSITVDVRAANTVADLASQTFTSVSNNVPFQDVAGRIIEIRVTLSTTRVAEGITPALQRIRVRVAVPACNPTLMTLDPTDPPRRLDLEVSSTVAGLSSLRVVESSNATVNIPAFTAGTTAPIPVRITRNDIEQVATVLLEGKDGIDGLKRCRFIYFPTTANLDPPYGFSATLTNPTQTFFHITNDRVYKVEMTINGRLVNLISDPDTDFVGDGFCDGADCYIKEVGTSILDLRPFLSPSLRIDLVTTGDEGTRADALFWE